MERIPVPENSEQTAAQTLRLLERAHIMGQLDAHDRYSLPLASIVDTMSDEHERDLARLDLLVNRLLLNFDVQPEEWRLRLQPNTDLGILDSMPDAVSAAEYLYKGAMKNIFSRTDGHSFGGVALWFKYGEDVMIELRASSQIQQLSVYENPHTDSLMYSPEDHDLIELMKQEHVEVPLLFEGVDAELAFTAVFEREADKT